MTGSEVCQHTRRFGSTDGDSDRRQKRLHNGCVDSYKDIYAATDAGPTTPVNHADPISSPLHEEDHAHCCNPPGSAVDVVAALTDNYSRDFKELDTVPSIRRN